jgi:hypothetical protein
VEGDDTFNNLSSSALSSHASTLDGASELRTLGPEGERGGERGNLRATLQKRPSSRDRGLSGDADSIKGGHSGARGKRFSKRQSKGVLAAVF